MRCALNAAPPPSSSDPGYTYGRTDLSLEAASRLKSSDVKTSSQNTWDQVRTEKLKGGGDYFRNPDNNFCEIINKMSQKEGEAKDRPPFCTPMRWLRYIAAGLTVTLISF